VGTATSFRLRAGACGSRTGGLPECGHHGRSIRKDDRAWRHTRIRRQRPFKIAGLTWIVERSFAWLGRNRRFSKDYEYRVQTAETLLDIAATHRHIQVGLIAQGLLQILSATQPKLVWQSFGSWIRTIRPGLAPSEQVVAAALRNTLPEFLASTAKPSILVKFIRDRLDLSRTEGTSLAA